MKILIKKATIIDPKSSHHMQTKDLLVEHGVITKIHDSISDNNDCQVFESCGFLVKEKIKPRKINRKAVDAFEVP